MTDAAKIIYHVGAWNRNYGDWALHFTIQRQLQAASPYRLDFRDLDSQRTFFDDFLIEQINREASLLLVGGGGLIFYRPEDATRSGWQFNISVEDLKKIEVPIVVLGVGFNQFPYDPPPFPDVFKAHLSHTFEQAALVSVRNQGSHARLRERGIPVEKVEVLMDPVSFCPVYDLPIPGLPANGSRLIGLNIAGDRPGQRFGPNGEEKLVAVWARIAALLKHIASQQDVKIGLIPHIYELDQHAEIIRILRHVLGDRFFCFDELIPSFWPARSAGIPMLASVYNRCDTVIGMRGHAGILAFSQHRPFIAFGDHPKGRYFCEEIGRPAWAVTSSSCDFARQIEAALDAQLGSSEEADLARVKQEKYDIYMHHLRKTVALL